MSVSYEYYKIFYYVAKYSSFNKAAAVLSNSQPNISRSINNLEAELNCKLFYRSHKGVTLTDAGKELFSHVEAACKHLDMGEDLIRASSDMRSGTLTIGFSNDLTPSIMRYLIFPNLSTFHKTYPGISMRIITEASNSIKAKTTDGLIDIAFITSPTEKNPENGTISKTILHSYRDTIIAGLDFKELTGRKISLKELNNYPLISLWQENETYIQYRNFLAEYGLEFNPAIQATSTGQILGYTKGNLGIGCIHPKEAKDAIEEKIVYKIDMVEETPLRHIALVHNKNKDKQTVKELINILSLYLKENPDILSE